MNNEYTIQQDLSPCLHVHWKYWKYCTENYKKVGQKFAESKKSSTFASQLRNALLAQLVEQLTLNQWVQGSSP